MFQNYFKIALRTLLRNKLFSFINIVGLSVSMTVCLLIILIVADQYSFDSYNVNKDRVYRIISNQKTQNGIVMSFAPAPLPLAERLQQTSRTVEKVAVIRKMGINVRTKEESLRLSGFHANADFLEVFDKKLAAGNSATALTAPNTIVLTAKTAEKLFQQENPIGKVLTVENEESKAIENLTVTGVLEAEEQRSHLTYESLISLSSLSGTDSEDWLNLYQYNIYTLLKSKSDAATLQTTLNQIAKAECQKPDVFPHLAFELQALRSINPATINLVNQPSSMLPDWIIHFFIGLAVIVLLLACFNYANLSLARSLKRAKEVGIRKVAGAFRGQIVWQFLVESIVLSLLALGGALLLLELLISAFYSLDAFVQQIFKVEAKGTMYLWFVAFAVAIGLLAGLSPALLLSRFRPVETLRKLANVKVFSYLNVRKGLIVLQFATSLIFIITTVTMSRQFQHTMQADLGFNTDNIINVSLQNQSFELYKQAVSSYKDVQTVSAVSMIPATNSISTINAWKTGGRDTINLAHLSVDPNYVPNFDLKLLAGRNFTSVDSFRTEKFIILNEEALQELQLGTPQAAIGQFISIGDSTYVQVIGVVENFVLTNVHTPARPIAMRNVADDYLYANVRVSSYEMGTTLQALESGWKTLDTKRPFEYQFYDEALAQANLEFILGAKIIGFAGVLAILIACMGLLGMVMYTTEARLKEVSIRKVLGADVKALVFLLSKSFLKLMLIAIAIGAPAAYFINNLWLQSYAYRIEIGFNILAISILALVGLALLTIGSQVFKAALTNPVENLSNE